MSRARQGYWVIGPVHFGAEFHPYCVSLGLSLRYWPCLYMPSVRLHVLTFKLWLGFQLGRHTTEGPE